MKSRLGLLVLATSMLGPYATAEAGTACRGTKLLHSCRPSNGRQDDFYYYCYAVKVPCGLPKYSLEGVLSPLNYPIVGVQYNVPRPTALGYAWSER